MEGGCCGPGRSGRAGTGRSANVVDHVPRVLSLSLSSSLLPVGPGRAGTGRPGGRSSGVSMAAYLTYPTPAPAYPYPCRGCLRLGGPPACRSRQCHSVIFGHVIPFFRCRRGRPPWWLAGPGPAESSVRTPCRLVRVGANEPLHCDRRGSRARRAPASAHASPVFSVHVVLRGSTEPCLP